jgi:hypothetical protein
MSVTVVSPGSSPVPVYNRSGVTVDSLAATGTDKAGGASIVRYAGTTVVVVSTSTDNNAVVLPTDAETGDVVEVFTSGSPLSVFVFAGGSDAILGVSTYVIVSSGASFRKIADGSWGVHTS